MPHAHSWRRRSVFPSFDSLVSSVTLSFNVHTGQTTSRAHAELSDGLPACAGSELMPRLAAA